MIIKTPTVTFTGWELNLLKHMFLYTEATKKFGGQPLEGEAADIFKVMNDRLNKELE